MMREFSKVLELKDYNDFGNEVQHINNMHNMLSRAAHRFEHEHRKWEYGLALDIIRNKNLNTILDVGGGGSVFAPALAWLDRHVVQVDPGDVGGWIIQQQNVIGKRMEFFQQNMEDFDSHLRFDCVTCLSVIEHVEDDIAFVKQMAKYVKPNGFIIITTDFHPDGKAKSDGHLRTYNKRGLTKIANVLRKLGFGYYGEVPKYNNFEPNVFDYSFASLVMAK